MPAMRPLMLSALSGLLLALSGGAALPLWAQSGGGLGAPGAQLQPAGSDWLAVGRLELGSRGFCTVTLIAQDRVLTAAHCLMDGQTGRPHPLQDLQVRLGYRDDWAVVTRGVRDVMTPRRAGNAHVGAGPRPSGTDLRHVAEDLAILVLDQPVHLQQVSPVRVSAGLAADGQILSVVSYAQNRSEAAALQDDCILIARRTDGPMVLDCSVDHGASGAPVMEMRGGEARIVAVISAQAEMQLQGFPNATVALAAPVDGVAGRALMRAQTMPPLAAGLGGAGAVDRVAEGTAAGVRVRRPQDTGAGTGGGARFVRPAASGGAAP